MSDQLSEAKIYKRSFEFIKRVHNVSPADDLHRIYLGYVRYFWSLCAKSDYYSV